MPSKQLRCLEGYTVITSFHRRMTMQKSSYQHAKKFPNPEFLALKKHFNQKNLHIEVEFSSASVWSLTWNPSDDVFSGVLELSVKPRLVDQHGVVQHEHKYGKTFRVEEFSISKSCLKENFLSFVLEEIKGLQCFVDGC